MDYDDSSDEDVSDKVYPIVNFGHSQEELIRRYRRQYIQICKDISEKYGLPRCTKYMYD